MSRKKKQSADPLAVTASAVAALDEEEGVVTTVEYADAPDTEIAKEVAALPLIDGSPPPVEPVVETAPVDEAAPTITAPESSDEITFPDYLLNAAGLTQDQARATYTTPDALADAIHAFDARTIQAGAQAWRPTPPTQITPPAQPTPAQPAVSAEAPASQDAFEMPTPSHEGDWDEDAKRLINSLREYHDRQLAKRDAEIAMQRQLLEQVMAQQGNDEQINYVSQFDGFVNKLGTKWTPVFGAGSGTQLQRDSMAMQNRMQLDMAAAQLAAGRRVLGAPELPIEELLARALYVAFPEHIKTEARHDVSQQLEARRQQFTARPSSSQTKSLTGRALAVQHADDWYKAKGMGSDGIFDTSVL